MKNQKIKYDKRDKKRAFILAIIFTVILVVLSILRVLDMDISSELLTLILITFMVVPIITLAGWFHFADVCLYFKRLRKYGYDIPENKSEYRENLRDLPKVSEKVSSQSWNKESAFLSMISFLCAVGFLIAAILIISKYSINLITVLGIAVMFLVVFVWLGAGFVFGKQCSNQKYKDDVEIDENRKSRIHLVNGLLFAVIMFSTSFFAFDIINYLAYMISKRV